MHQSSSLPPAVPTSTPSQPAPSRRAVIAGLGALATVPLITVQPADAEEASHDGAVEDLVLLVGSDETQRNLAWFSTDGGPQYVELVRRGLFTRGHGFPRRHARRFLTTSGQALTDGYFFQHATVTDLWPDTGYVYRVGSESAGWSDVFEFRTLPRFGPFDFLVVADPQIGASGDNASDGEGWAHTLDVAERTYPDAAFVLSAGDQIDTSGDIEAMADEYTQLLAPPQLTSLPVAPVIGNHDEGSDLYKQHWNVANQSETVGIADSEGNAGGNSWFRYRDVLLIALNSNNMDNAAHLDYVAQIQREHRDARWVLVSFHHSVFSSADHAMDEDVIERRRVLPAGFSELGVDLVLMGHDHHFTRSYLMNVTRDGDGDGVDDNVLSDFETAGTVRGRVVAGRGDVLYLTCNSCSGSKYYETDTENVDSFYWVDRDEQRHHPNLTRVRVGRDTLRLVTLDVTDGHIVDEVELVSRRHGHGHGHGGHGHGHR
jgi:hypothetical protein